MEFKLGEFFCGPGGIALGAIHSGKSTSSNGEEFSIKPFWASDYDQDTCMTYSLNIHGNLNHQNVIHDDVRTLNISSLNNCDGFAFGFPCNDFSIVGESKGLKGNFGPLYSYGIQYLTTHKPMWLSAFSAMGGLEMQSPDVLNLSIWVGAGTLNSTSISFLMPTIIILCLA